MDVIERYNRNGYAAVRQVISPSVANAFLRQLVSDMDAKGTPLTTQRNGSALLRREAIEVYGFHYPPMLALLWGLTPFVSEAIGRDLLPAYSYFRIYQEGDVCRVHSDRPSCEHSLSLTLDYSDGVPWDLEIGTDHISVPNRSSRTISAPQDLHRSAWSQATACCIRASTGGTAGSRPIPMRGRRICFCTGSSATGPTPLLRSMATMP